jgi:predicted transcriptional regulator
VLSSKQKKCAELMATGEYTQKAIAGMLKITPATICNWKKDDEFRTECTAALRESIRDVAAKAFQTQTALLKAKSEMVRYMAAKDVLDRAGFKAEDKVAVEGSIPIVITGSDRLED